MARTLFIALVLVVCLAAAPSSQLRYAPAALGVAPTAGELPTDAEFANLLKADIVRGLEAVLARSRRDVRGFTATMQKQELAGGVEVVRVAVREEPFAVRMVWEKGATGLTSPTETLYVRGENQGRTRAKTRFLTLDVDVNSAASRGAARYSIADSGFANATLRTLRAWKASRDAGTLRTEYLGTKPIPECGNRVCHVVRRTCDPAEVDNYGLAEPGTRDPKRFPKEAIRTVTLMFDVETWLQVGSDVRHADGSLIGAYYFRDVVANPDFGPNQFRW